MMVEPRHVQGRVKSRRMLTPSVAHVVVAPEERTMFSPGQFAWIAIERDGETIRKPYSIASAPWEEGLAFCIKRVDGGRMSVAMAEIEHGAQLDIHLPLGHFTVSQADRKEGYLLLVGTGTGVAPLRSIVRSLFPTRVGGRGEDAECEVILLAGYRTLQEALYHDEFSLLAGEEKRFKYLVSLSREEKEGCATGYVQERLPGIVEGREGLVKAYLCGMAPMVMAAQERLIRLGVPQQHIKIERYG